MIAIHGARAIPARVFSRKLPAFLGAPSLLLTTLLAFGLLIQGAVPGPVRAQSVAYVISDGDSLEVVESGGFTSSRDSLRLEIHRYSAMVNSLRDSLSQHGQDIELSEEQRLLIEENIDEITVMIDAIAQEMSQLEFEISNNTISLVNEAGEGVVITIPENLDERLSEGFQMLSEVILSELPDSIDFDQNSGWDWSSFVPKAPPPPRKIVRGNLIKVWDDLQVTLKEDVRGNVVVIFGDCEISGRVDGNVIVVFGNLLLDETAEITGKAITAGGRLDQDPEAEVSGVVAVDPLRSRDRGSFSLLGDGLVAFLISQGVFLLTVLLAVVAVVAAPTVRFDAIVGTLRGSAGPSLGLGLIGAMVGHLVVAVLLAVLVLTVIGVPLALLVFLGLVVLVILAVTVSAATLGHGICVRLGGRCPSRWVTVVVGLMALHLVSFLGSLAGLVPVGGEGLGPVLGIVGLSIKATAYFMGLGALILSRLGARSPAASA
jgi:hypothetical protein